MNRGLPERTLRTAVGALGAFHLVLGLYEFLLPGSFFHRIGEYGEENTHYVGDVGAFTLAYGIALLIAVGRPRWRAPTLLLGAIWYAIHAINHLFDVGEASSQATGIIQTLLIAAGAGLLFWLARAAEGVEPPPARPRRFVDYDRDG
jgi:hypothetical protein